MANRKPKARNDGFRIEVYKSLEHAESLDRSGLLDVQNFDTPLTGLQGLESLDMSQDFEDMTLVEEPCYIVIRKNKGYTPAAAVPVKTRKLGGAAPAEAAAEGPSGEEIPF